MASPITNQILASIRVRWIGPTDNSSSRYSVTRKNLDGHPNQRIIISADGVTEQEAAQVWINKFIVNKAGLENAVPMTGYRFGRDVYFSWKCTQPTETYGEKQEEK